MKRIVFSPLFILLFSLVFIIGFFIGYDINSNFRELYLGKMSTYTVKYILIMIALALVNIVVNFYSNSSVVVREKNSFNLFITIFKCIFILLMLLLLALHIPIFIFNCNDFLHNYKLIIEIFVNQLLVLLLLSNFLLLIDIKMKKMIFSSVTLLAIFAVADIISEYFYFIFVLDDFFQLNCLFILPVFYNSYIVIMLLIIMFNIVILSFCMKLSIKEDYFLKNESNEN